MNTTDSINIAQLPSGGRNITLGPDLFIVSDNINNNHDPDITNQFLRKTDAGQKNEPFRVEFTTFLLCVSGHHKMRINLVDYEFSANTLLIAPEGSIGERSGLDVDSGLLIIAFSKKMNPIDSPLVTYAEMLDSLFDVRCLSLQPAETEAICNIYNILRLRLEDPAFPSKIEMAKTAIMMIVNFISHYLVPANTIPAVKLSGSETFIRFLQLLDRHCTERRDIEFYASELSMSPRALSRKILMTSRRSVKTCITDRIILEAKVLLNQNKLTVLQISDQLGFPNQSFFGTF
ncbi:MAG: AraC family transcriptional regulator, partial [Muribaculaceae bacterium]|nr:AraC family transcriptional regulator [Muribaculaceae bacterium]